MNDDITFNQDHNEEDRILRERGFDPDELTDEERKEILGDVLDDDPENDHLGNIMPADERDGTDA